MRKFILLSASILLFLLTAVGFYAERRVTQARLGAGELIAQVSFELFDNRVYLPVTLDGETVTMILDNGAAASGLSTAEAQKLRLSTYGAAQLRGNGESLLPIKFTRNLTFSVAGAQLVEKSVAIVPYHQLERHEGRNIDGVLGVDLFYRYVIRIDYPGRIVTLYDPSGFVYRGKGMVVPLKFEDAAVFPADIIVGSHDPIPASLEVDLGTYSGLRFYSPFAKRHSLPAAESSTVSSFDFGIGGEFPVRLGRVDTLKIGGLAIDRAIAIFPAAQSGATTTEKHAGTVGGGVFSRFILTLDFPHHQMMMEPAENFAEPFAADASGMFLVSDGASLENISVEHVLTGTPAELAGVRPGDVILRANGTDARKLGLERLRSLLCQPGKYNLTLQRDGRVLETTLHTTAELY